MTGGENVVRANEIVGVPTDAIVVASGRGNLLEANVIEGAHGCGVFVLGTANDTVVEGCTIADCGFGLVTKGMDTSLTGTSIQGSGLVDLLDPMQFVLFEDNAFGTRSQDSWLLPH